MSADAALAGISAAGAGAWQEGVQQSFLDLSTGLTGILPSIEQPGIPLGEAADALAAAGASARLSAQSIEISNRITNARIGGKGYLSMNVTWWSWKGGS